MTSDETLKKFVIGDDKRKEMAREAFYGGNELLADRIKDILGYEMNGHWHPANGFGLDQAIKTVSEMEASELLIFLSNPTYVIVQNTTELLSGDEKSIGVIYNNLTGRNFTGTKYTDYVTSMIAELQFPQLAPSELMITVR
jgi:hypothetical protein